MRRKSRETLRLTQIKQPKEKVARPRTLPEFVLNSMHQIVTSCKIVCPGLKSPYGNKHKTQFPYVFSYPR